VSKTLQDLVRAHLAIVAILESKILSVATREQLEVFRNELEQEIAVMHSEQSIA
jgi:hypothetical protein